MLRALTEQHDEGGSRLATLSLARTAAWLTDEIPALPDRTAPVDHDPRKWLTETDSPLGRLRHALPPVAFDGAPMRLVAPARTAGGGRGRLAHGLMRTFSAVRSSIAL